MMDYLTKSSNLLKNKMFISLLHLMLHEHLNVSWFKLCIEENLQSSNGYDDEEWTNVVDCKAFLMAQTYLSVFENVVKKKNIRKYYKTAA